MTGLNIELKESNLTCEPFNHYGSMDSYKDAQSINCRKSSSTIMKHKGILLSLVFLASVLAVPIGYSYATMENATNSTASGNASGSGQENVGQQVSDFVHQTIADFKQQREDIGNAIKDCREKITDATPNTKSQVADECHKNLQSINEKYKDERKQFQELFKEFRESIITLKHEAKGMKVSSHDIDTAIKQINDDVAKNGMGGLENALGHLKGMGLQHGKPGVEKAMQEVSKTTGVESTSSSNASLSHNTAASNQTSGSHEGNDKGPPDKGKGSH